MRFDSVLIPRHCPSKLAAYQTRKRNQRPTVLADWLRLLVTITILEGSYTKLVEHVRLAGSTAHQDDDAFATIPAAESSGWQKEQEVF